MAAPSRSAARLATAVALLALLGQGAHGTMLTSSCNEDIVAMAKAEGYSKHDEDDMLLHTSHLARAQALGDKMEFVAYGDSISEDLSRADDALAAYAEYFEMSAFGIGGDKAGELLWRILNGEFNVTTMSPDFVSILIGTNDLRRVASRFDDNGDPDLKYLDRRVSEVLEAIASIVSHIHQNSCGTHFILQAILPTAYKLENSWPNVYTPAFEEANRRIRLLAEQYPQHVSFVDCGDVFLEDGMFKADLMKDHLHPTRAGHLAMASCVLSHTLEVVSRLGIPSGPWPRRAGPPGPGRRRRG